jgi:hypothetical protein
MGFPGAILAQNATSEPAPYRLELKRVAALAMTKDRFAAIAGKPREGNFMDTSLALTGWKDCSLYGAGTYTCDSHGLPTAQEAEMAQATLLRELKSCLGDAWIEVKDRSSSGYAVLHNAARLISMTLSADETDKKENVIHLIVFVRRN